MTRVRGWKSQSSGTEGKRRAEASQNSACKRSGKLIREVCCERRPDPGRCRVVPEKSCKAVMRNFYEGTDKKEKGNLMVLKENLIVTSQRRVADQCVILRSKV